MRRHHRKARAPSKRTAHQQLQKFEEGVVTASEQLIDVADELRRICSYTFVCIEVLRAKTGDVGPDVAAVLDIAYKQTMLTVLPDVEQARAVLEALGQGGAK